MPTTPVSSADRVPDEATGAASTTHVAQPGLDEGPAAAALLSAAVGAFTLGLLTTLAEASATIKDSLALTDSVGPLSGKTTYTVIIWLVAWAALHVTVGRRTGLTITVLMVAVVLLGLGLLGTFPIFFELFTVE